MWTWTWKKRVMAVLATALAVVISSACAHPMTPAELEKNEAHAYPGHDKDEVFRAAVTALKTMGYDVVVADAPSGRIKTAPKLVTVVAHGSSSSAVAAGNSLAWNVDVTSEGDSASVHAEPRGYSAGQAVDPSQMNASFLQRSFATLYSEIDSNLPSAQKTASKN